MVINNIHDLAEHLGTTVDRLERDFYKYTDCGAWIHWDESSVAFGTIVEGSDAEFNDDLLFPFSSEFFDECLEEIENQADIAWHEANNEDEEEITLEISKVNIKYETFCTTWDNKVYCVDICEDMAERGAWLYNPSYGIKSFMFGCMVNAQSREAFLDTVFSNLPDYIESYADEYED